MPGIHWLGSYPKSGSTWMRALLTSYARAGEAPDINALQGAAIASDREWFDEWAGLSSADLTPSELLPLRARFHASLCDAPEPLAIKVHAAYARNADGVTLFPPDITAGVIYLIRNPLDVVVSYAHHDNTAIERIVQRLGDEAFVLNAQRKSLFSQFPEPLGSWSQHVRSWVDDSDLAVKVVRYEDLSADPEAIFGSVLAFLGKPIDQGRIKAAVDRCSFEHLRRR